MLDKNKTALAFGLFFGIFHAVWSLLVAIIPNALQSYLNWVFVLHAINPYYVLLPFNFVNAVILVVMTFVIGYIFGWIFAWGYNLCHKKRR